MTNYSSLEKREVCSIFVNIESDNPNIWRVGDRDVESIYIIDLQNRVFLVNDVDGSSVMVYDVETVGFSK